MWENRKGNQEKRENIPVRMIRKGDTELRNESSRPNVDREM
jgi:hypothetical protein